MSSLLDRPCLLLSHKSPGTRLSALTLGIQIPACSLQAATITLLPQVHSFSGRILLSLKHLANLQPFVLTLTLPPHCGLWAPLALCPSIAVGPLGTMQVSVIFHSMCWVDVAVLGGVQCWAGCRKHSVKCSGLGFPGAGVQYSADREQMSGGHTRAS